MAASILLVEDEPGISRLMEIQLSKTYDVRCVFTAQDAANALATHEFDLVVLDVSLPDRPCWDILTTIVNSHPATRTLVMTGHTDIRTKEKALSLGAQMVVAKPITPARLQDVIKRILS
jgi:DNA-binding NtrC family response regulator